MNIKDSYIYSPISGIKCKYPVNVSLEGCFFSKNIILQDDILGICLKELEAKKIFSSVTKKNEIKADVILELKISDYHNNSDSGLMVDLALKQLPDKKIIYQKKFLRQGDDACLTNPDLFAALMKNLITACIDDIDNQFSHFTDEGTLPRNYSAGNVTCAVFKFDDSVENETYGEFLATLLMTGLTRTGVINVIERDKIYEVVQEKSFRITRLSDPLIAKHTGTYLNADFLIYGGITRINNKYHVTMHVVDVSSGEIVLSRNMETGNKDNLSALVKQHTDYIGQFISK